MIASWWQGADGLFLSLGLFTAVASAMTFANVDYNGERIAFRLALLWLGLAASVYWAYRLWPPHG
jgi:hypothetical protein